MGFGSDYSGYIRIIVDRDDDPLRLQRFFRNTADALYRQPAVRFDLSNDEPQLVHVSEQQYAWGAIFALNRRPKVSEQVLRAIQSQLGQMLLNRCGDAAFATGQSGNQAKLPSCFPNRIQPI